MKLSFSSCFLAIFMITALIHAGTTRDLRNVAEPKIPKTYASLKATGADDTAAIQKALDSCAKGEAVALSSGIFHSGPLNIPSGVSLLVDSGVTLKAIPDPKLYDLGDNRCGTINYYGTVCKAFITISNAKGSGIYGKGTIDGQGGEKMIGYDISWWTLTVNADVKGIAVRNPLLVNINDSEDITVYQITLINSPFHHLVGTRTKGFTVWGVTVNTPHATRYNDGIVADGSQNVTIAFSNVFTQSDNIGVWSLNAPAKQISVYNNNLISGSGLTIWSATLYGVSEVSFCNITLSNLYYGIRIFSDKQKGRLVSNIIYDNICIINVLNPINLDTDFFHLNGSRTPEFRDINFNNVWVKTGGNFILNGNSDSYPIQVSMNDVHVPKDTVWSVNYSKIKGKLLDDSDNKSCGQFGIN